MKKPQNTPDVASILDEVNFEYKEKAREALYHAEIRPIVGSFGIAFALFMIGVLIMIRNGMVVFP